MYRGRGCQVTIGLALAQVLAWGLAVGGVVRASRVCDSLDVPEVAPVCSTLLRSWWWNIFFQLLVSVGVLLVVATNTLERFRIPAVVILGLATMKSMQAAEGGVALKPLGDALNDHAPDRLLTAGFVIASIVNFVLIGLVGTPPTTTTTPAGASLAGEHVPLVGAPPHILQLESSAHVASPAQNPWRAAELHATGYPRQGAFDQPPPPTLADTHQQQAERQTRYSPPSPLVL